MPLRRRAPPSTYTDTAGSSEDLRPKHAQEALNRVSGGGWLAAPLARAGFMLSAYVRRRCVVRGRAGGVLALELSAEDPVGWGGPC